MATTDSPRGPLEQEELFDHPEKDPDDRDSKEAIEATRQIDMYIEQCRVLYRDPLINEETREAYEKMWGELRAGQKVDYMRDNVRLLSKTLAEAKSYKEKFQRKLDEAVEKKWIGKKSRDNWWKRFENSNVLEWDRKKWLTDEFPAYLKGWQDVAKMRHEVRALAKKLNLKENQVPELKGIFKIQEFLALQFDERKSKVSAAKAALLAHEKKQQDFYAYLQDELTLAVENGYLHKSKVGPWLKRVMEAEDPYEFRSKILLPFMDNWEAASKKFDKLHIDMQKGKIPRGLRLHSKDAFLQLSYEQRASYLHEVELRMNEKVETDPKLDSFKKNIRHNLDTKDWEGAEDALSHAQKAYPADEDLDSMATFLRLHRPHTNAPAKAAEESPDPQKTLDEMRVIVSELPSDLQWLYIEAMKDGPEVFNRLLQLVYNRVWVYEHRYSNEELDREHAASEYNKEKTRHYIENGHSRQFERNILDGDTATEAAIRDECTKPQVLYMGDMGRESILRKVKTNKDNEKFGYWTTLVPTEVPYAVHRNIVKNCNYKLKSGLRQLDKQGYTFTLSGLPQHTHDVRPAEQETKSAAETQYSMAA